MTNNETLASTTDNGAAANDTTGGRADGAHHGNGAAASDTSRSHGNGATASDTTGSRSHGNGATASDTTGNRAHGNGATASDTTGISVSPSQFLATTGTNGMAGEDTTGGHATAANDTPGSRSAWGKRELSKLHAPPTIGWLFMHFDEIVEHRVSDDNSQDGSNNLGFNFYNGLFNKRGANTHRLFGKDNFALGCFGIEKIQLVWHSSVNTERTGRDVFLLRGLSNRRIFSKTEKGAPVSDNDVTDLLTLSDSLKIGSSNTRTRPNIAGRKIEERFFDALNEFVKILLNDYNGLKSCQDIVKLMCKLVGQDPSENIHYLANGVQNTLGRKRDTNATTYGQIQYDDSQRPYIIQAMRLIQQRTKIRVSIRDGNIRMMHIMRHYFYFEEPKEPSDSEYGDYGVSLRREMCWNKENEYTNKMDPIVFESYILRSHTSTDASTTEIRENSFTLEEDMIYWINLLHQDKYHERDISIFDM